MTTNDLPVAGKYVDAAPCPQCDFATLHCRCPVPDDLLREVAEGTACATIKQMRRMVRELRAARAFCQKTEAAEYLQWCEDCRAQSQDATK